MKAPVTLAIVLLVSTSVPAWSQERVNPFEPPIIASEPERDGTVTARARKTFRHPRLRAVLRAMNGSMANLNGHIIGIDESALGYQLVAVHEHSAEFMFRGSTVRLHVANDKGTSSP